VGASAMNSIPSAGRCSDEADATPGTGMEPLLLNHRVKEPIKVDPLIPLMLV
jgi:hypothetical protein